MYYFSTFITGFSEVIAKNIDMSLTNPEVASSYDGLILYKSKDSLDKIKQLKVFNNSFLLLKKFDSQESMHNLVKELLEELNNNPLFNSLKQQDLKLKGKSFRFILSDKNQFVSVNKDLLDKLEKKFASKTGMAPKRMSADFEFWLMIRSENISLFGLRLTRHGDYEKTLEKGELRPELAHLMCLVSEINSSDIVLDPFAGSGRIAIEAAFYNPSRIIASDINEDLVKKLENKVKNPKIEVKKYDALDLFTIENNSIDKIITDPPWGLFEKINIDDFYEQMFKEFNRILKDNGVVVILTSRKIELEKYLASKFVISEKIETLVSGQKATVYKIVKKII